MNARTLIPFHSLVNRKSSKVKFKDFCTCHMSAVSIKRLPPSLFPSLPSLKTPSVPMVEASVGVSIVPTILQYADVLLLCFGQLKGRILKKLVQLSFKISRPISRALTLPPPPSASPKEEGRGAKQTLFW